MSTPKYSYKGTDINKLIVNGTNNLTNYIGFPAYATTTYSSEKPLPFNISSPTSDVSTLMASEYHDFTTTPSTTTTSGTYSIPGDYNAFRAILVGGGGGGGGAGGCGWSAANGRTSANGGGSGGVGSFIMIETAAQITTTPATISYTVGGGGNKGPAGGARDNGPTDTNYGPGGKGNNGEKGAATSITISIGGAPYTIYANGGSGGYGGDAGGPSASQGDAADPAPTFANTYTSLNNYTPSIPTSVNPIGYSTNVGTPGPGGPGDGSIGGPGYIRLYLLKS